MYNSLGQGVVHVDRPYFFFLISLLNPPQLSYFDLSLTFFPVKLSRYDEEFISILMPDITIV